MLFITHDFDVVRDIADHVAVMQLGRIVEQGPAGQVLDAPRHDFTRKLLAAVPSGVPKTQQNASSDELLSVSGLNLVYESRGLLGPARHHACRRRCRLHAEKGETLGVVGESGSGKVDPGALHHAGARPTSGRIVFDGVDIAGLSGKALRAVRRRVQMVFQDPYRSLNPRRRILHALIEGPIESGVDRKGGLRAAAELMALVGLPADGLQRYPHQFSGGQRQRICIARALAMEPDLIVADEAVSALDVSVQAQVLELFEDLQKRLGFAMIFITHDLRVAAQVCDRIGVMQKGACSRLGPVRQVIHAPQHPIPATCSIRCPAAWARQRNQPWSYRHDQYLTSILPGRRRRSSPGDRRGAFTPAEVTDVFLRRIQDLNPAIGAFVAVYEDGPGTRPPGHAGAGAKGSA